MENIYEIFLGNEFKIDNKLGDFDYSYSISNDTKSYNLEFNKFLNLYKCYQFLSMFNGTELELNSKKLEHITKIYLSGLKLHNEENYRLIGEFLITFYKSIEDNKIKKNEFNAVFDKYSGINNILKNKYITFQKDAFDFYMNLIDYVEKNKKILYKDTIERILKN